jgi:hypothetical protein
MHIYIDIAYASVIIPAGIGEETNCDGVHVRVDEDDVGVVLERLGEEGAGDAAADDDHAVAGGTQHAGLLHRVLVAARMSSTKSIDLDGWM